MWPPERILFSRSSLFPSTSSSCTFTLHVPVFNRCFWVNQLSKPCQSGCLSLLPGFVEIFQPCMLVLKSGKKSNNNNRYYLWQPWATTPVRTNDNERRDKGLCWEYSQSDPASDRARGQLRGITSRRQLLEDTHIPHQCLRLSALRRPPLRNVVLCLTLGARKGSSVSGLSLEAWVVPWHVDCWETEQMQ